MNHSSNMSTSNTNNLILDQYTPLIMMEKTVKWRPSKIEIAPNCPRCSSSNTKFCYYNNYSVSQPRYFCKSCRRYWTKGGSLRNVPIGGGCRKSCRSRGRSARQPSERGGDIDIDISATNLALAGECAAGDQFRQVQECVDGQDFVYQNFDGFGVEGVFGEELWSEGTDFLQEFEVFSSDDQLRLSEDLVSTDNWGSFDLSGYEDF